jgi:formylglycine-generating enzyme required for sulfatase activity
MKNKWNLWALGFVLILAFNQIVSRGKSFDTSTSFTDNGDGTVTDKITRLMWQQADSGEITWEDAKQYSNKLSLAGFNDWRLPQSHEMFGIVDHAAKKPAFDRHFNATNAEYYWTSNIRLDDPSRVWVVNAGGGIGPHPKRETISAGGTKSFAVRCVRGDIIPLAQFIDNGDGTVTDKSTGLSWQQGESPAAMTNVQAIDYCEKLSLGGHDDWRLPNAKELRTINNDKLASPSIDTNFFHSAAGELYWTSTSLENHPTRAWFVDFRSGLVSYEDKTSRLKVRAVRSELNTTIEQKHNPGFALIPGGKFEMGDHHDLGGQEHRNDEVPIHDVSVDSFYIGITEVTNQQYSEYLNSALQLKLITIKEGLVYSQEGRDLYCETLRAVPYSRIDWDGEKFSVIENKNDHPMVGVRWIGTAAYCNWLSSKDRYLRCYDLSVGSCDFSKNGYRLPTEAEWEYAARGGIYGPYYIYTWGNDEDYSKANWPRSGDPFESGPYPWTTPVGFYNGELHQKADFNWPGREQTYQTSDGANGYGLYDMAGNVWEWCNDWYLHDYYAMSISDNPPGPAQGRTMPDGKPYHVLRGGNWYNGQAGHSRTSNRNPAHFRGPKDPDHEWYHIGFRVVRDYPEDGPRENIKPQAVDEQRLSQPPKRGPDDRYRQRGPQRGRAPGGGGQGRR